MTVYTLPGMIYQREQYEYATPGHLLGLWSRAVKELTAQQGPVGVADWIVKHIYNDDVQAKMTMFMAQARLNGQPILLDIEPMPNENINDWPGDARKVWHEAVHLVLDEIYKRWPAATVYGYRMPYDNPERGIRFGLSLAAHAGQELPPEVSHKRDYWAGRFDAEHALAEQLQHVRREFALPTHGIGTVGLKDRLSGLLLHGYQTELWRPQLWFPELLDRAVKAQRPFCVLMSPRIAGHDVIAPIEWQRYIATETARRGGSIMLYDNQRHHDKSDADGFYGLIHEVMGDGS